MSMKKARHPTRVPPGFEHLHSPLQQESAGVKPEYLSGQPDNGYNHLNFGITSAVGGSVGILDEHYPNPPPNRQSGGGPNPLPISQLGCRSQLPENLFGSPTLPWTRSEQDPSHSKQHIQLHDVQEIKLPPPHSVSDGQELNRLLKVAHSTENNAASADEVKFSESEKAGPPYIKILCNTVEFLRPSLPAEIKFLPDFKEHNGIFKEQLDRINVQHEPQFNYGANNGLPTSSRLYQYRSRGQSFCFPAAIVEPVIKATKTDVKSFLTSEKVGSYLINTPLTEKRSLRLADVPDTEAVKAADVPDTDAVKAAADVPDIDVKAAADVPDIDVKAAADMPGTDAVKAAADMPDTTAVKAAADMPDTTAVKAAADVPNTTAAKAAADVPNTTAVKAAADVPNTESEGQTADHPKDAYLEINSSDKTSTNVRSVQKIKEDARVKEVLTPSPKLMIELFKRFPFLFPEARVPELLYNFIWSLLQTPSCTFIIGWSNKDEHEFFIKDLKHLAMLYSFAKRDDSFDEKKLLRVLSYYTKKEILSGFGRRYNFLHVPTHPIQLMGFVARAIRPLDNLLMGVY